MINTQQIAELQDKIVRCFANDVRERWDFLLVNFGREKEGSEKVSEIHEVIFRRDGNAWKRISVISPPEGQTLLNDLALLMSKDGNQTWYGCILEVDSSGKYRFTFSPAVPKFMHGSLDEVPMADYTPQVLS